MIIQVIFLKVAENVVLVVNLILVAGGVVLVLLNG
jgi:hypothetical protein